MKETHRPVWVVFFDGYESETEIDDEKAYLDEAEANKDCDRRQVALKKSGTPTWAGGYGVAKILVPLAAFERGIVTG